MEHSIFTTVPVNNEIELCEVNDPECKQLIELLLYSLAQFLHLSQQEKYLYLLRK